ncbi:MAG: hypothetical protein ABIU86_00645, partial [Gemmatimonadaceae bacterium]
PVPANLPLDISRSHVVALRSELRCEAGFLFGHFGTYGEGITEYLRKCVPALLGAAGERQCLLLGRGATDFRSLLVDTNPAFASRIHAPEGLAPLNVARHLIACDAMIQPFPEGVSGRRSSLMPSIALGVPTITTSGRLTEPVWEIADGVATSCTTVDDFTRLAEKVFQSPARLGELAAGGMALYRKHFAIDHTIEKLRANVASP